MGVNVAVITGPAYRQVVVNPGFDADTNWNKGSGWTISGGVAVATAATGFLQSSVGPLINGNLYRVTYTITRTAGSVNVYLGGAAGPTRSASGTYTDDITATGTLVAFASGTTFTGTVDNVHVVTLQESFTRSGFGTPKAVYACISSAITNNSAQANASFGMGITDGVREYCVMGCSVTGSTADSKRIFSDTLLFGYMNVTDGSLLLSGNWSAWVTDGVRIEWNTVSTDGSGAPLVTIVIFGGTDLTAYAGDFTSHVSDGEETVVSDHAFKIEQAIILAAGDATAVDTVLDDLAISLGFVDQTGGIIKNISNNMLCTDAAATTDVKNRVSTTKCVSQPVVAGGVGISIGSITATSFSVVTDNAGGYLHAFLALKYNNVVSHWVGVIDSPTSNQEQPTVVPKIKPQFVLQCPVAATAIDSNRTTDAAGAGSWAVAAFDSVVSNCIGIRDRDAVTTAETEALSHNVAVRNRSGAGAVIHTGEFFSFDDLGWTIDYTTANATVRKWPAMAIGVVNSTAGAHQYDERELKVHPPGAVAY